MKIVINFIYSVYVIATTILLFILYSIPASILYPFGGAKRHYNYSCWARIWAKTCLLFTGLYPEVKGDINNLKQCIYVFNHQSQLDTLIALAILPPGFLFIAKEELFKVPFLGNALKRCGYIPIKRQNSKNAANTLLEVQKRITAGSSVLVFPEGTRSITGKIGQVKRGGIMLAFDTKTDLLPVVINPAWKIMPKGSFLLSPQKIQIIFGERIAFDWENKNRNYTIEAAKQVELALNTLLQKLTA